MGRMKYIKTAELQKAYDNWNEHMRHQHEEFGDFWVFAKIIKDEDTYIVNSDSWALSPESVSLVNILNSPYRKILYKVWKIRHENIS